MLNTDGTRLCRPEGGSWMKPAFASSLPSADLIVKAWELDRTAEDCSPGAGLAGTLLDAAGDRRLQLSQIDVLLQDPFVERGSDRRMEQLCEVGIGIVASVPFFFDSAKGLMLYFYRKSADMTRVLSHDNAEYLVSSASLVGSSFAIRKTRDRLKELRQSRHKKNIGRIRRNVVKMRAQTWASFVMDKEMVNMLRNDVNLHQRTHGPKPDAIDVPSQISRCLPEDLMSVKISKKVQELGIQGLHHLNKSRKKWRGAGLHGPSRRPFSASLFSFAGVFLVMATVLQLERVLKALNGNLDFKGR